MWTRIYLKVKSKTQGEIKGDVTAEGREKQILCYGVSHDLEIPRDNHTGLPNGEVMHRPVCVTTPLGSHTPGIHEACCSAEPLEVEIGVYRINRMGEEENFLTFKLEDAVVVENHLRFRETGFEDTRASEHVQDISFGYRAMSVTHHESRLDVQAPSPELRTPAGEA